MADLGVLAKHGAARAPSVEDRLSSFSTISGV